MAAGHNTEKKSRTTKTPPTLANKDYHLIAGVSGVVYTLSKDFSSLSNYSIDTISRNGGLESIFENPNTFTEITDQIQQGKTWAGHTIFLDDKHDEFVAKVEAASFVNSRSEPELKLTFTDISKSKKNEFIETKLLKAITVCTEILFSDTEADIIAPPTLETIGKALDIDRCYISKIIVEKNELFVERRYTWLRNKKLDNKPFSTYKKYTYNSFFEVLDQLNAGKLVAITPKSKVGKEVKEILKNIDVKSFLKVPIFKDNNLWGYIGFEDTVNIKEWTAAEKKALKSLAQNLGAHIKINSLTEELKTKNQQLENAIEGANDGLWAVDYENDSIYFSPQLCKIFGYSEDEFPKSVDAIQTLLKTEDTELLALEVVDALTKKTPHFEVETVAKHKTGKYIWLKCSLNITYDNKGNVLKNSGSVTDITTEKTYELKIRRQE